MWVLIVGSQGLTTPTKGLDVRILVPPCGSVRGCGSAQLAVLGEAKKNDNQPPINVPSSIAHNCLKVPSRGWKPKALCALGELTSN